MTVYYTAVLRFHSGPPVRVANLGSYPSDFVDAVKDEGTGKISDGRYLNWSFDTGYWLDTAPRNSTGGVLRPFRTAAADPSVLRAGRAFTIVQCGHDEDGSAIDPAVCAKLRGSHWTVADEFTPGLGGPHHVDVYIGEETRTDFTDSPWYTTLTSATLAF